jgi:hypothetical protein
MGAPLAAMGFGALLGVSRSVPGLSLDGVGLRYVGGLVALWNRIKHRGGNATRGEAFLAVASLNVVLEEIGCDTDSLCDPPPPGLGVLAGRKAIEAVIDKPALVREAECIDMLGWNLNRTWFADTEFVEALQANLVRRRGRLRVVLPARDSAFLDALLADRAELGSGRIGERERSGFLRRYEDTIDCISSIEGAESSLRFLDTSAVLSGIVRFDGFMVHTAYVSGRRGSNSPSYIYSRREGTPAVRDMFDQLVASLEAQWERARP